ncbi:hypothetical protein ACFVT9_35755 [Kitasatospora cineracea]|uniref:hypothetical protein n=1 Tax=Kitasatospora cineracea TaxID=88074 RepID=UPI0036DC57D4
MDGHRPVLAARFDLSRPADPARGWTGPGVLPAVRWDWAAAFDGTRLLVTRPDGTAWYDGPLAAAREWTRALRAHQTLTLTTGAFRTPFDFPTAAAQGRLSVLNVPARLLDTH